MRCPKCRARIRRPKGDAAAEAIETLVRILRVIVPLAAAAQQRQLRLQARITDILGDYSYCLDAKGKKSAQSWLSYVYDILSGAR